MATCEGNVISYDEVRPLMRTGDMLLWHTDSAIGAGIRAVRKSNINHASVIVRLGSYENFHADLVMNAEAEGQIVLNLLSRRLEGHDGECYWYPLSEEGRSKLPDEPTMVRTAMSYMGLGYDTKAIAEFVFGRPDMDDKELICSEYVLFVYGYNSGKIYAPDEMPTLGLFQREVRIK